MSHCIFIYNPQTGVNEYFEEDFGSISNSPTASVDYNEGTESIDPQQHPLCTPENPEDDWGLLTNDESIYPFGTINVSETELVHPEVDYTPHYGIDRNVGISTFAFKIVGEPRYYSPRYPINDKTPGSGIGTISIYGFAGTISINPYPRGEANVPFIFFDSANESFSRAGYSAVGITTLSGSSEDREIQNYGYYGDERNPGTSGVISISSTLQEEVVFDYVGSGTISKSGGVIIRNKFDYNGSGTITTPSGAAESSTVQTTGLTSTTLYQITGTAQESILVDDVENTVLFTFNSAADQENTTKHYTVVPSDLDIFGESVVTHSVSYLTPDSIPVRFVTHLCDDDLYDTCDSDTVPSDYDHSASTSLTVNPPEDTILYTIGGNSEDRPISVYSADVSGIITISGTIDIKSSISEISQGSLFTISSGIENRTYSEFTGSGPFSVLSGSSESYLALVSGLTAQLTILGSAITAKSDEYLYPEICDFSSTFFLFDSNIKTFDDNTGCKAVVSINISGISHHSTVSVETGSGTISISGYDVVYPNIKFIPSPDGFGDIFVTGASDNSLVKTYDFTSGSLFYISSGFESFSKSGYVGIGTILYAPAISADVRNNPFQIPRSYTVII